ncbi:branched-chain amino acid aminotransferase [Streptomyces mesophilus]|uniref:branched-chain amino acid aminotransferase n=1 Tax=Streptomyces mesophilus TaxID=1775132 RepID=UPI003327B919
MTAATMDFEIRPASRPLPAAEREAVLEEPGFGQTFTDHMVTMRWSAERGWHDGRLEPYGAFTLEPATSVFHYGQALFEGMKAYRQLDGGIALFRPEANAARFNASARRMAMPELPPQLFVKAVELLVAHDRSWVPDGAGRSLYLRPFMIATDPSLGFTHPSRTFLFCVVASPATAYFGAGAPKPLSVWLSTQYTRAVRGGTGYAKTGGNYAGAFAAGLEATAHGCDQVVWLDAVEHRWAEEMGGMNLFFVHEQRGSRPRLTTPPLTGTLLPGVTRDSLLTLAPKLGYDAVEAPVSIDQWRAECASGELTEVFACGTAAVIAPVGTVKSDGGQWTVADGEPGPVTLRLRRELLGIQHGSAPDPEGWVHHVR